MRVGVVGAGLMGSGIAQVAAAAGHDVVLHDVDPDALRRSDESVRWSLGRLVAKGRLVEADADAALARLTRTTDLADLAGAGLVVEAVVEDADVKHEVLAALDRLCAPSTVLATNTSAIPVTRLAEATGRADRVVGTHFFAPAPLMPLCEVVRGARTSEETVAAARAFAESCGKTVVVVERDVPGFVVTRLVVAMTLEAARLVEAGVATAEDVDTACRLGLGHAMGPLETADLSGVDVLLDAARTLDASTSDGRYAVPAIVERLVAEGRLGRKTGEGFRRYPPEG